MKRRKVVVGISLVCLFIAAIAIPASFGGGIGLRIDPPVITVKPGTLITYDITLSSHDSDCYDVTIIPCTCNINWFEWTGKKQVCVPAGGKVQMLLNVAPSQTGNFEFKVKAVSIRDPRTRAEYTVKINSTPYISNLPDFIITKIWQDGQRIHYELMNVGFADAPAGSTTGLYINGVYKSEDPVNTLLAPNGRIKRSFNNFWGPYPFPGYTVKVCANYDEAIEESRYNNNRLEENWFNQPYLTDTTGPTTSVQGVGEDGIVFTSNPGVGGDGLYTSNPGVGGDGPSTYKSGVGGINEAPTCIALMPDLPEPQSNGMVINWTACAFDPEGDTLLYRFVLGRSDSEMEPLEIVQDWSPSNVWKWKTDEGDISPYNVIYADVRDGYHANDDTDPDYDESAWLLYWIK
ncbi:MAG: CARDB domain-containing protein [Euryarchaeota archaeon]|nr:CARDB domain-containing protein [Euryarchaeota archaeon]